MLSKIGLDEWLMSEKVANKGVFSGTSDCLGKDLLLLLKILDFSEDPFILCVVMQLRIGYSARALRRCVKI